MNVDGQYNPKDVECISVENLEVLPSGADRQSRHLDSERRIAERRHSGQQQAEQARYDQQLAYWQSQAQQERTDYQTALAQSQSAAASAAANQTQAQQNAWRQAMDSISLGVVPSAALLAAAGISQALSLIHI